MKQYRQTLVYGPDCDLPVYDSVDVLVAGGGPSGVAAAETAASHGLKTIIIEKNGYFGGAAVAGYSGTICGLFYGSDHAAEEGPRQCVYGWTDRFWKELDKRNGVTVPQLYGKTYLVPFDPQVWKEAAEDLVLAAGAKILYHTDIIGVIRDGKTFCGVVINTKNGFAQIRAQRLIDATGDADLIYRAGEPYTMGENGSIQNPTMIFRLGGVDVPKFLEFWGKDTISPDKVTQKLSDANQEGMKLPRLKVWVYYTPRPDELFLNVTLITGKDGRALNVCDVDDHTEAEQMARKQVREYAKFFKEYIPGCEKSYVNDLSPEIGVRQTRTIVGLKQLKDEDIANARKYEDGIARSAWPVELHNGDKPYMYWLINDYYEIPYGALVPADTKHLIVAGRNLCAEHRALASCRVTAQCFEYGHAAALATCLSLEKGLDYGEIDGREVRRMMNLEDARLDT